jgi:hypothetical protein
MDRTRALFRALLPPGDEVYTAGEIAKRYYPGIRKKSDPALYSVYEAHTKALNRLMRDSLYYDKPDNADPVTGRRPPGKKNGSQHPRRWKRETWLQLVSDELYEWLQSLRVELEKLTAEHPRGTRFFLDLKTLEITFQEPVIVPGPKQVDWPDSDIALWREEFASGADYPTTVPAQYAGEEALKADPWIFPVLPPPPKRWGMWLISSAVAALSLVLLLFFHREAEQDFSSIALASPPYRESKITRVREHPLDLVWHAPFPVQGRGGDLAVLNTGFPP